MRRSLLILFRVLSLSTPFAVVAEDAKGWYGFVANVDVDGFFRPTLRSIKIGSVVAGSPAQTQGLVAGDEIIEVEGLIVAGSKASELQPLMEKKVGETLHVRGKHLNGEIYSAALIAERRR